MIGRAILVIPLLVGVTSAHAARVPSAATATRSSSTVPAKADNATRAVLSNPDGSETVVDTFTPLGTQRIDFEVYFVQRSGVVDRSVVGTLPQGRQSKQMVLLMPSGRFLTVAAPTDILGLNPCEFASAIAAGIMCIPSDVAGPEGSVACGVLGAAAGKKVCNLSPAAAGGGHDYDIPNSVICKHSTRTCTVAGLWENSFGNIPAYIHQVYLYAARPTTVSNPTIENRQYQGSVAGDGSYHYTMSSTPDRLFRVDVRNGYNHTYTFIDLCGSPDLVTQCNFART